jgi:hypothetical protein
MCEGLLPLHMLPHNVAIQPDCIEVKLCVHGRGAVAHSVVVEEEQKRDGVNVQTDALKQLDQQCANQKEEDAEQREHHVRENEARTLRQGNDPLAVRHGLWPAADAALDGLVAMRQEGLCMSLAQVQLQPRSKFSGQCTDMCQQLSQEGTTVPLQPLYEGVEHGATANRPLWHAKPVQLKPPDMSLLPAGYARHGQPLVIGTHSGHRQEACSV